MTWRPEDVGLSSTANYQEGYTAVQAKINELFSDYSQEDMSLVLNSLLADWPYEFYWFASTQGYRLDMTGVRLSADSVTNWTITLTNKPYITVTMQVSQNYQNGTTTSIDTAKINAVKEVVPASAQNIVSQYANASDYEKLQGYAQTLCQLTNYNDDARDGNVGEYDLDPWQVVYVFDNDDSTMVVCEGYSKAFKYLCDLTSFTSPIIKCYLVSGTLASGNNDGGRHMWNIVTMEDGKNYLVDVTNSDDNDVANSARSYDSFLLKGGTPDNNGWYAIANRNYLSDILYFCYDSTTQSLCGNDILTLSSTDYTYTAPQTYTITWKDDNGTVIDTTTVAAGETPDHADPTKAATAQYTYTFAGWTPEITAANQDTTYTAAYTPTVNQYTITWNMDDGTLIDTTTVAYGQTPTHADPEKASDAQNTYTFSGWSPEVTAVTGNAVYAAQFTSTPITQYTITVYNAIGWENLYYYYHGLVWPGNAMTCTDPESFVYTATIPSDCNDIMFSDGSQYIGTAPTPYTPDNYKTTHVTSGIADQAEWVISKPASDNDRGRVTEVRNYYLVGNMNDWGLNDSGILMNAVPVQNSDNAEEYRLTTELAANAEFKIKSDSTWYPDGGNNNYQVTTAGTYTIRFRPNVDGGEGWHYNVLKAEPPCTVTFDSNLGSNIEAQTVVYGNTAVKPEPPTRTNYTFLGWYNGETQYDFNTPVTADLTLTAHWQENTVPIYYTDINGITTKLADAGVESFTSGSLDLPPTPYLDGYTYEGYILNGTEYKNKDSMLAEVKSRVSSSETVNIKVNYKQSEETCDLTVSNGVIRYTENTTGKFKASSQVYVTANADTENHIFNCWKIGGIIVGYERTYAFRMPADAVTVEAVYVSNQNEISSKVGTAYIESVKRTAENKLSFVSIVSVPEGARIERAGIIANTEARLNGAELTVANAQFVRFNETTCKNYLSFKYTWTKGNVSDDDTWCVRAYLVYTMNETEYTVLSAATAEGKLSDFS